MTDHYRFLCVDALLLTALSLFGGGGVLFGEVEGGEELEDLVVDVVDEQFSVGEGVDRGLPLGIDDALDHNFLVDVVPRQEGAVPVD